MAYILGFIFFIIVCNFLFGSNKSSNSGTVKHTKDSYFPNRCFACTHYADALDRSRTPNDSGDFINCPINGSTRVGSGCLSFNSDMPFMCDKCVNARKDTNDNMVCSIYGKSGIGREYCQDAIHKETKF